MRMVAFIPSKLNSERLPRKNILPLRGVPLVNYALRTLNKIELIDDIIIYASEPSIREYIEDGLRYKYMNRPAYLDGNEARVQDFTGEFLKQEKADIIILHHITSPFLKPETVLECIESVSSGRHNCAFAVQEIRKFAWFKGKPLNYSLKKATPRTQDLEPVLFEQSGLYVFKREIFESSKQRIGLNPYLKLVDSFEGHDIDTAEDFKFAELIAERRKQK